MTKKANRRFLALGAVAVALAAPVGQWHQATGSSVAYGLLVALMLASFMLLVILGALPWLGSLALKHPLQNTRGYRSDYAAEPEMEVGHIYSQGWRRKRERVGLRVLKSAGLYIEPAGTPNPGDPSTAAVKTRI